MEKDRLVILSDYGLDDAAALMYLLMNRARFSSVDIVAVGGNVSKETSLANAITLFNGFMGPREGINIVSSDSIGQEFAVLTEVHGGNGMGDVMFPATMMMPHVTDFFSFLKDEENKDPAVVLSLGPLTVTKLYLEKITPKQLVIMAGVCAEKPNFNGVEFNQALDETAYNECVKYPSVLATLDTARVKGFNLAGYRFEPDCLFRKLVNRAIELAEARHADNAYIYDLIAALYLTMPDIFGVREVSDVRGNAIKELYLSDKDFSLADVVKNLDFDTKK